MKLYIGCTKSSHILIIDPSLNMLKNSKTDHIDRISNFGYAWTGSKLFAASTSHLQCFDPSLTLISEHFDSTEFDRVHQILAVKNNIYICDTALNLLRIFDHTRNTFSKPLDFNSIPWMKDRNTHWINSINYIDGTFYMIAHNHGWSSLLEFDKDLNFICGKESVGFTAHNVWKMKDKLWTLSSADGFIRSIDGQHNIGVGGFLRGVALSRDYLLIGVSICRDSDSIFQKRPKRPTDSILGVNPGCGIAIFDSKTLEFRKFIPIPDALAVLEVRMIDEIDYATYGSALEIKI